MNIISVFGLRLSYFCIIAAVYAAAVYGQTDARESLIIGELNETIDKAKDIPIEELHNSIESVNTVAIPLASLWADPSPPFWVSDIGCYGIFRILWPAAGLSHSLPNKGPMTQAVLNIPSNTARTAIILTSEFRELCRRGDTYVWDILRRRAALSPDLIDACIAASIMWGDEIQLLPNRIGLADNMSASTLLPQSPPSSLWLIPHGTPDQWQALFKGSNGVYRLLSIKGLDLWASSNEIPSILQSALDDPYISIKDEAVSRLQVLEPEEQTRLLNEYLNREKAYSPINDTEKEATSWINERIANRLSELKASPNSASPSTE